MDVSRAFGVTRVRVGLMLALVAASGCSLAFQPPSVSVAEVRLTSLSLTGGVIVVTLDVVNPNVYALESQDFRYALAFAGGEGEQESPGWINIAEGRLTEAVRIPAEGSGSVSVEVPFDVTSVGSAVARLLRRGELEYRFTGALRAGTPLGSRTIPFDQRGLFRP